MSAPTYNDHEHAWRPYKDGSTERCYICGLMGDVVVAAYAHPLGKTIRVMANGKLDCRDANGKKKPTSATAVSLAAGHGKWERVL
jgi:hypothetical protein